MKPSQKPRNLLRGRMEKKKKITQNRMRRVLTDIMEMQVFMDT